ncbi:hypothetical protein [Nocardioides sp.]|uniref:hypothetical protein n=1 Tax=Nocardioides sp. TaxID=35761 RepID=UPI0035B0CBA5
MSRPGYIDKRGNNESRRRRRTWLLATFDEDLGPGKARCLLKLSPRCIRVVPIEEARALRALVRSGLTITDTAKRVGKAASHVSNRLMLLELPLEEQEELRAGHYTITHAQHLVRNAREAERRRESAEARPVGRPKGAKTKPYFGDTHPLASTVRRICSHRGSPKVGGVGCGACWEHAIRADAQEES